MIRQYTEADEMTARKKSKKISFSGITSVSELIAYLDDSSKRLEKCKFLYHYTSLGRVIDIYKGRKWHLANAKCMNDQLEYSNGDADRWENIFFASFMVNVKENIGMWSMYAQPWKDGVLLKIPKDNFEIWIEKTKELYEISCSDFQPTGSKLMIDTENKLFLSSVAYTNCDNQEAVEKVTWSIASNTHIHNATHIPELTGYIKDSAWDYEREIRIKAVLKEGHGFKRVAIDVPDDVLDSIQIIAGPLFEGKLENRLREQIDRRIDTNNSLFYKKLHIEKLCAACSHKQNIT
ncbi:MAG: DUF2971 domain-containing protein [Neglectibacter timonensis]